jgi:hypothetical protein
MSQSIGRDAEVSLPCGVSFSGSSYNGYDQPISHRSKASTAIPRLASPSRSDQRPSRPQRFTTRANNLLGRGVPQPGTGDRVFGRQHQGIFEEQLDGWYRVPAVWPAKRDSTTFQSWFDVSFHSMVVDVCDEELEHEDL